MVRGKKRDYSGGTNFKKTNHGQPGFRKGKKGKKELTNKRNKDRIYIRLNQKR